MSLKKTTKFIILLIAVPYLLLCFSCTRGGDGCGLTSPAFNPYVYLQLKDSQGADLLDPKTTSHYDTTFIKKNNPSIFIAPAVYIGTANGIWLDYTKITGTFILKLSATLQDTLKISSHSTQGECAATYSFGLLYDGKNITPDQTDNRLFVVAK